MTTPLPGRKAEAARNDTAILDAAREVFLRDPQASMAVVARTAGVGVGGLYRRYPSKDALLQKLCGDGLREFVALARSAADDRGDPFDALAGFLRQVVSADLHALTVRLGGTFVSTGALRDLAVEAAVLIEALVGRASGAGRLRRGFVSTDVPLLLEQVTAVRVKDPGRTTALRFRALELALLGLDVSTSAEVAVPGVPPTAEEMGERWRRSHPEQR